MNKLGAEWRSTVWAGRIGGLASEFYQPFGQGASTYVMPYGLVRNEDFPVFTPDGEKQLAEYRVKRNYLGFETGWTPLSYWRFLAAYTRGSDKGDLRIGNPQTFFNAKQNYSVAKIGMDWDSLDDAQFPSKGAHVNVVYNMYRPWLGGDQTGDVAQLRADWVPDFGLSQTRYHLLLGMWASSALSHEKQMGQFFEAQSFLGGFLNLSGYPERSLHGDQSILGRAVVYRRTGQMDAIFSTPIYVGASLEAGNTWQTREQVRLDSLIYAGSLFLGVQTPLGPLFLGYGYAQGGHNSVYLTFGSLIRPNP
jgi:NTE family protein